MNQNNFSQAIAEFFESTLGASHVEFKVARNSSKILTPSIQSQAGGLKISVPIKSDSMEFEISHPLVDIDFDPTSTRLVFFGSRLLQLLETQRNSERDAAIAQTTQMLAHDVRKPFSLLKVGLNMISNAKDETSIRTILARMIPEIDKSIKSVDGMITDVMEIGSTSTAMITEPACVKTLIQSIWSDTMRFHPNAQIQWRDSYQHTNLVPIHSQKISRVFANIFENALQSMHSNGTVWVKTQQFHDMIEICIGNSGSVISPENLSKIFDAFYTHGKKGGTGLGLAIAKKIISAHGGTIWCESAKSLEFPEGQVEFFFTLPLTQEPS